MSICEQGNDGVVIVDAGGGTIDISAYIRKPHPFKQIFEEISVPQCEAFLPQILRKILTFY
jgi:hypothetical protein